MVHELDDVQLTLRDIERALSPLNWRKLESYYGQTLSALQVLTYTCAKKRFPHDRNQHHLPYE